MPRSVVCPYKCVEATVIRRGFYRRRCDGRHVKRYQCLSCKKTFSGRTFGETYREHKPEVNAPLRRLLISGVSQRGAARLLQINLKTVQRKLPRLAIKAKAQHEAFLRSRPQVSTVVIDEMETFEHTKCKPLAIALAVVEEKRLILGFSVSRFPAKGHLAKIARKKYGQREDKRRAGFTAVLRKVAAVAGPEVKLKSDENPHYPKMIREVLPGASHVTYKGRRGCVVGQGELKRGGFDPLFSLNHTAAMLRANINRLFRRTWCTTKVPERLADHIYLYIQAHNEAILSAS